MTGRCGLDLCTFSDFHRLRPKYMSSTALQQPTVVQSLTAEEAPPSTSSQDDDDVKEALALWRQAVVAWYPNLLQAAHFLPPVYMHRTQQPLPVETACGQSILVTQPACCTAGRRGVLMASLVKEDQAHQKVLSCIHGLCSLTSPSFSYSSCLTQGPEMSQGPKTNQGPETCQGLFVISQLQFGNYLNQPAYAAAVAKLRTARDPAMKAQNKDRGDFDLLLLYRRHGIVVGEIKSVGDHLDLVGTAAGAAQLEQDAVVGKKVRQAIAQLRKSCDVLTYLVPTDAGSGRQPAIRATLMLPNVSTAQLQRVVSEDPQIRQALCECLGLPGEGDPVPLCLTADVLREPSGWWQRLKSYEDPAMSDDLFLDIVSRFAGPATTVTVYTSSGPSPGRSVAGPAVAPDLRRPEEGIAETAGRFAPVDLVLHPGQVEILGDRQLRRVWLNGPPGCGKTLLLVLKARDWLREKRQVHVLSTWFTSLAASHAIQGQLRLEPVARELVTLHAFDLDCQEGMLEVRRAVETLSAAAVGGRLNVIADEAYRFYDHFGALCSQLQQRVSDLHLWAASIWHGDRPLALSDVSLTEPLRTPPCVTRLVQECGMMGQKLQDVEGSLSRVPGGPSPPPQPPPAVHPYTPPPSPLPCDGPDPIVLEHPGQGQGQHAAGEEPHDCQQCGRELGHVLRHRLHVGKPGRTSPNQPVLRFSDVFILTWTLPLRDDNSGLLAGLREAGVPVTLLTSGDATLARQVALRAGPEAAVATYSGNVSGLERARWWSSCRAGPWASTAPRRIAASCTPCRAAWRSSCGSDGPAEDRVLSQ